MELRDDPASIAPERALVFEVQGSLKDFYAQAAALGLEYLGETEEQFDPSEDFQLKDNETALVPGRIYLAMPDVRALQELISLWRRYKARKNMPTGKGPWRELFDQLIDVRPWGPQDRVPDDIVRFWETDLAANPQVPVRLEIELWFHEAAAPRTAAFNNIQAIVAAAGGTVLHGATIEEIRYSAMLADVPAGHVRTLIDQRNVALALSDEIMYLRPQSVARFPSAPDADGAENATAPAPIVHVSNAPIAALLDGLPLQNHSRLIGRLEIDDPDALEALYPVARREHGTEMASLIIHGDLNRGEEPIQRPLHVRPLLRPNQHGEERTPEDRLLVDIVYRAVRRMKEGDGQTPATAPSVVIVNFSLCDARRPYAGVISPLGRLLDYLAFRYKILFLVSAGNILDRLPVPHFENSIAFEAATPEQRERAILAALNGQKSQRTLLCPAEAVNVLTIGAANDGSAFTGTLPAGRFDPFTDSALPNIASGMGLGFKKCVKPELLFEGGRAPVSVVASGGGGIHLAPLTVGARHFGAKTARPRTGSTSFEDFTWGTSVSTALATRASHRICDALLDGNGGSNHTDLDQAYLSLVLKALLVHGAKWGSKGELLDEMFEPHGQGGHLPRRDDITRLLGYGVPNIERVVDCAENRATLLGWGSIAAATSLLYRIPLPTELDGLPINRAATITLAWFSPINSRHKGYRMAALDVSAGSDQKFWIVNDRDPFQPTDKAIVRGTVYHERRTGDDARLFVEDGQLLLRVTCRATAGELTEPVPYAMAVSFEAGIETGIPVYERIRARLLAGIQP